MRNSVFVSIKIIEILSMPLTLSKNINGYQNKCWLAFLHSLFEFFLKKSVFNSLSVNVVPMHIFSRLVFPKLGIEISVKI